MVMNMLKVYKKLLVPFTIAFLGLFMTEMSLAQVKVLDKIVAIVDDGVVLKSELDQRVSSVSLQIAQSGTNAPPMDILTQQVLDRLILERLQLTMGYNAGVRISDEELNQAIARVAANNQLSTDQYIEQIKLQGSTINVVREEIRNELTIMRVQQGQVMRRIRVSEQELDNYLNSEEGRSVTSPDVNIGQILLSVPSGSSRIEIDEILERATLLFNQTTAGKDFRELAIANSADQSALQGGDLGWRNMAQLPDVFIQAVGQLDIGDVSKPIRSGAGYHLIKVYDRRGGEKKLVEQHFARHILIKPNQIRDEKTTIEQLKTLADRIIEGEDFAALAKEFSEDPGSGLSGGELGWSTPGMFVPEFEEIMNTIAVDDISSPFSSQFGWHILQVTERREQDFSQDILRNRAQNMLRQRKYDEELQVWLQEIKDEAFIEIKETPTS